MDVETENKAVLVVLNQADQFYREQQRLAKAMRKGFLDLAKARGVSTRISALDCREEIHAQFTLSGDDVASLNVNALEGADAWRKYAGGNTHVIASSDSLRRRGETSDVMTAESNDDPAKDADTVLLFTALAPPALRKAKREFVNALVHVIKLANAIQRINVVHSKLENQRFAV